MKRRSLNKHSPLPGIKSPTEEPNLASSEQTIAYDDVDNALPTNVVDTSENTAATVTESKPQAATTTSYKLKDLPLEEVIGEVEVRITRLKTFDKFSNSDCSDDLRYLNASTRCGSNPEVVNYAI